MLKTNTDLKSVHIKEKYLSCLLANNNNYLLFWNYYMTYIEK